MSKRERMNIKVDADLVRKAKVVAAARQITLSDYVSELMRPHVEADLSRTVLRLGDVAAAATGPPAERGPELY